VKSVEIVSYVMSGGVGSRLWPLSREDFPKQFHDFSGQGSMLTRTLQRLQASSRIPQMPIHIIGAEAHESRLRSEIQGQSLQGGRLIFEPVGRNTAAAVALATHITWDTYGDALMLIVPSDHEISDDQGFWASIETGMIAARAGRLVTFGIVPDRPETGYGYIEIEPLSANLSHFLDKKGDKDKKSVQEGGIFDVRRFVEKPDLETAKLYLKSGQFLWNSGIFLFSAQSMRQAFEHFAPQIWQKTKSAYAQARSDVTSIWLPYEAYQQIPADSVDYAIMERAQNVVLVPARFEWNDLGSWQALLNLHQSQIGKDKESNSNVVIGDVVAIDCSGSYLRSQSGLLSAVGLKNMAVVKTMDATFVAPVEMSQEVRQIVAELEKTGRLETKFTPSPDHPLMKAANGARVRHWLFGQALPLWARQGVDDKGVFHERLDFDARPVGAMKRMRTLARQIYVFAVAHKMGWEGEALPLIEHGLNFITAKGRGNHGGWISSFHADGSVLDGTEDLYDQAFVLLALAHAHAAGYDKAWALMEESLMFLDEYLADERAGGFFETPEKSTPYRRSNPHMHLLEAYLSWFAISGEKRFLERACHIVDLFETKFFDGENWTLGEYFTYNWQPALGVNGAICEPGHHFEWAWLLAQYADYAAQPDFLKYSRKLYASTLAYGINRTTGLCFNQISQSGRVLNPDTRSWQQTEALKAAIALDDGVRSDLTPEIEARVGQIFRWHIDPAPKGLWIDAIDARGRGVSRDVPASILYHLVCALNHYLDSISSKEI